MKGPLVPAPKIVRFIGAIVLWAATVPAGAASAAALLQSQTYAGELERNLQATIQNFDKTLFEALANILLIAVVGFLFVALVLIILCCRETVLSARGRARPNLPAIFLASKGRAEAE